MDICTAFLTLVSLAGYGAHRGSPTGISDPSVLIQQRQL